MLSKTELAEQNFMKWLLEITTQEYKGNITRFNQALNKIDIATQYY